MVYGNDEVFTVGKAKVVRKSDSDQVLVVAAGVTLHEALKAADTLAEKVVTTVTSLPSSTFIIRESTSVCWTPSLSSL